MALFHRGRKTVLAGLLSCGAGLASVLIFYISMSQIGDYNELWGTYIFSFSVGGYEFSIWQEYALFFCLPISLLGFFIGNIFGNKIEKAPLDGEMT
jgi:hypothetical protein